MGSLGARRIGAWILLGALLAGVGAVPTGAHASCSPNSCGLFVSSGTHTPCSSYFGPGSCRVPFGCYCDESCYLFGDCCSNWSEVCNRPTILAPTPAIVPTTGGPVRLDGLRFQFQTSSSVVLFDGTTIVPSFVDADTIDFTAPPGVGPAKPVVVRRSDGVESDPVSVGYLPPSISSVSAASRPTAGGTTLTIAGSNFGPSGNASVDVLGPGGATPCPVTTSAHASIECTLPEGQGANLTVRVEVGGQLSQTVPFAYDRPVVTSISPTSASSSGGTTLSIFGSNFGTASTVTVDGRDCPVTLQTHDELHCILPAGSGTNADVIVEAGLQQSDPFPFSYAGLRITGLAPTSGPTAGGIDLTLVGSGFDGGTTVTVAGAPCPVSAWTPTQLTCTLPAGQGRDQVVDVASGGQRSNPVLFNYAPPQVAGVFPNEAPTSGGTLITLTGSNFGTFQTVTIGTRGCPVQPGATHTQLQCALPEGEGENLQIVVTVAGQSGGGATVSYAAPNLSALSPSSGSAAGGTLLTINGSNFGLSGTPKVGGAVCPVQSRSHSQIVCQLPPGTGEVPVVVEVLGRPSSSLPFTYTGPYISAVSPQSGPTAGGIPLSITGSAFGPSGAQVLVGGAPCPVTSQSDSALECTLPAGQGPNRQVVVTAGGASSNTVRFDYDRPAIANVATDDPGTAGGPTLTLTGSNFGFVATVTVDQKFCPILTQSHTSVECLLPAGQGAGVDVVVTSAGQASDPAPFGYAPPVLDAVAPTSAPTGGGTYLTLAGSNFGVASRVSVGGQDCPVTEQGHDRLVCTLPAGQGSGLDVVVDAGGQPSNAAPFSYDPPVLTAISPTTGPTTGGVTLTVAGSNFGVANQVTVGDGSCPITQQSSTLIACTLPAGQGIGKEVRVQAGNQPSNAGTFDYLPPSITSVVPSSGPTAGGVPIAVVGTNFGSSSLVTVGGIPCPITLQTDVGVTCTLPPRPAGEATLEISVGGQTDSVAFTYADPTPTPTATATATPTPTPVCEPTPRSDCRAAGRSVLTLRDRDDDERDQLIWTWVRGAATDVADFGDPQTTTDYRFCLYENGQPWLDLLIPPGGTCARGKPCWKTDKSPYRYSDAAGTASGVTRLQLKAGVDGRASVQVKGKGVALPDPLLPPQSPVTAQLVNADDTCWSTTFAGPASKSTAELFKVLYKAP